MKFIPRLLLKTKTISPIVGVDFGFGKDTTNKANTSVSDVNIFLGATHSFERDLGDDITLGFSPKYYSILYRQVL